MNRPTPPPGPLYILRGANSPVTSLYFPDPCPNVLLSGSLDGRLHVWNLKTRRIQQTVDAHCGNHVLSITSLPQSTDIITWGRSGHLKQWKLTDSSCELNGHIQASALGFCGAAVLPQLGSSTLVALPDEATSRVKVYDLNSRNLVQTFTPGDGDGQSKLGMCMSMSAVTDATGEGTQLLTGYENGSLVLWDLKTGKLMHELAAHSDAVMCLDYCSADNKGLSGSVDEQLVAWSVQEDKLITSCKTEVTNPGFNSVVIRNDGRIAVTGGWDQSIRVFGLKKLKPLAVLTYHRENVQCLAFSSDHLLAAGSKDNLISLWDVFR